MDVNDEEDVTIGVIVDRDIQLINKKWANQVEMEDILTKMYGNKVKNKQNKILTKSRTRSKKQENFCGDENLRIGK